MGAKTGLVVAILGGLVLHASGARAGENVVEPPHPVGDQSVPGPAVQPIPSTPAGPTLVPGSGPAPEPNPTVPVPALAVSPTEPRMIHEPRVGFLITGVVIAAPAYLLQILLTTAYSPTIQTYDEPCSYCAKAAALTLIPIVGPWLGSRAAGEPDDKGALIFGGIEAAALAMIIVGFVGHDVPADPEGSKVSLAPFVTPEAGGATLRLRW